MSLKGSDLLSLYDFTKEEIEEFLKSGETLKIKSKIGENSPVLAGKKLGLIFEKPSTRTRVSFEVAMYELGGHAIYLSSNELQLKRGETIADTAKVLSRYLDGIMARVFFHKDIVELAKFADIPVINGLSDMFHPCQVLGDLLTIKEKKGRLDGIRLTYLGDGNNVCHSLMLGGVKMGMQIVVSTPIEYKPDKEVINWVKEDEKKYKGEVLLIEDPVEAIKGSDVVYTDVWVSMGQEDSEIKKKILSPYQVNERIVKNAKKDFIFMHCLPAHRGEEVVDEVIDSENSVVFDQAENRLHIQKGILSLLL
ncbi:MAG TPA: ornithine carbamoyltransferase [Caldisericia bacterium]|nr:ornithine carbamoyltransferase [Caldisericia bacterium]HPB33463.1 ornithine carbamoyltransferase [Caldisericia bacterium]HQL66259.1 ornithine carbamoyltransferase [Caldisericia bacterium]HQN48118.1 ornithine carbamoyltransferase [Caldisericia bacterium]HQP00464.1 ornithine carbamoyltransferase [Caldisericia bacterium]